MHVPYMFFARGVQEELHFKCDRNEDVFSFFVPGASECFVINLCIVFLFSIMNVIA